MVNKFLITTGLEETWETNKSILFLGEWCRLHSRKKKWENMGGELVHYHWDNREKLFNDYKSITEIYERILADLCKELNTRHGVDHDLRYWRILIGPWLGYFTGIFYDRWFMIDFVSKKTSLSTIILTGMDEEFIPNDMASFMKLFVDDEWNHFIFGKIIRNYSSIEIIEKNRTKKKALHTKKIKLTKKQKIKRAIAFFYSKIANISAGSKGAFFITTHLQIRNLLKLFWHFRQLPILPNLAVPDRIKPDFNQRNWEVPGSSYSEFEDLLRKMIPQQIPIAYLEGYSQLVAKSKNMGWPKHPSILFTSNSYSSDDIFKTYAAEHRKKGTPFVIGQHGGHYGSGKWSMTEDHEIAVSDKYLSWGWVDPLRPKIKPVGQIKILKYQGETYNKKSGMLLITHTAPRYSYVMFSGVVAGQWLEYLNDQFSFVQALTEKTRNQLIVRLYKNDYGFNQHARWKEKFPSLKYDFAVHKMEELMSTCRIFVSTYNATTYLESISVNIPTVIYWNPKHWEIRDNAIPFFEELKAVKIFHETPESAAQHINDIWNNVDAWWNSENVRQSVNRFRNYYCYPASDLIERIETELRSVYVETVSLP